MESHRTTDGPWGHVRHVPVPDAIAPRTCELANTKDDDVDSVGSSSPPENLIVRARRKPVVSGYEQWMKSTTRETD
jgi:hypothetical protein